MRRIAAVLLILSGVPALAFTTAYLIRPVNAIQLISQESVVRTVPVPQGTEIYLDYQHSVIRAPVREVFEISDTGGFLLTRTEHGAFGAGLPTESFGEFRQENDLFIISGINRSFPEIRLRVSAGSDQTLTIQNGSNVVFLDLLDANDLVIIRSRTLPRAGIILVGRGSK